MKQYFFRVRRVYVLVGGFEYILLSIAAQTLNCTPTSVKRLKERTCSYKQVRSSKMLLLLKDI